MGVAGWQSLGQRGVISGQNSDGLPLDQLIGQAGNAAFRGGKGQVYLSLQHHLLQHGAACLPQLQADLGKGFDELGQDLGEQTGGALHADAQT